mmetsp:Transcript_26933/g.62561  ORF Transcript_26933/g.62561 Transcript_26933/m.62561 type:complete len:305 (+) Transcript_26933:401-1315(+)
MFCQKYPVLVLPANRSPWNSLVLLFLLVVLGAVSGQFIASIFCATDNDAIEQMIHIEKRTKLSLLVLQAITASSAFIAAPIVYLYIFTQQRLQTFFQWRQSCSMPMLTTLGLVLAFMVVNTWFIQWNMDVKLPNWLSSFEMYAQNKEAVLKNLTRLLTSFNSLKEFGVGILVMGLIPAIGEELVFRGLVQHLFHRLYHNIHLAIGSSAFIFSAIHLQFYGFVPRFLLGVLLGYIYWWTKDLRFPIAAHLLHNTCVLFTLFLHQQKIIVQDTAALQVPPKPTLLFFAVIVFLLANFLQKQRKCVD